MKPSGPSLRDGRRRGFDSRGDAIALFFGHVAFERPLQSQLVCGDAGGSVAHNAAGGS